MLPLTKSSLFAGSESKSTISVFTSVGCKSNTKAIPPDIPAAKFRPVDPSTITEPPVMYSQPWSPTPSTIACAPEFRTQNLSPTTPEIMISPDVAP